MRYLIQHGAQVNLPTNVFIECDDHELQLYQMCSFNCIHRTCGEKLLCLVHVGMDILRLPGCYWTMEQQLTTKIRWGWWTCPDAVMKHVCRKVHWSPLFISLLSYVYMQDEWGETALFAACRCGYVETAKVLLDHGANVHHRNKVSVCVQYVHTASGCSHIVNTYIDWTDRLWCC